MIATFLDCDNRQSRERKFAASSLQRLRRVAWSGCLYSCLLLAIPPYCQPEQKLDLAEASLEDLQNIKVYTASRHYQSAGEAPSSVTVITRDEIQKFGYRTLAEVLRSVRGFFITSDRSYSYLGVRGFLRPGDYNTRILLMIDGHRVNDNVYDQAMLGTEFLLDVDLIDHVEVVRGPSSSLYGSNAFFAVLNVITRRPSDVKDLELSFDAGSFGTYTGRVTYSGHLHRVEGLLSGTFHDSAGQDLFFPEFNSPQTNRGIAHNLNYDRSHDLLLTLDYRGLTFQALSNRRDAGIPTAEYEVIFGDPRTHAIDQHQYLDLSYRKKVSANWELVSRGYYDRYGYDADWPFEGTGLNVDYARGQRWGAEMQASVSLGQRHRLTFGSEVRDNFQQDQKNYDQSPALIYVNDRRSSWVGAGFIQDEVRIHPKLTLNLGLRHDQYQRYGGNSSPRAALIYHPFEKSSMKILYGSAFRAPNVYEAFYGSSVPNLSGYRINPDLQPETFKNIEAVWEQGFGTSLQLSVTVFRSYVSNLISLEVDPVDGMNIFRNADRWRSTGAGVECEKRFGSALTGRLAYSYTKPEDAATDRILAASPRHLAKLNISAPLKRDRLFASLEAQYQSSRQTLGGNKVSGFPLLNFTLLGRTLARHVDLSASVYNFLDRKYYDPVSTELPEDSVRQNGRSFRVKVTWSLGE